MREFWFVRPNQVSKGPCVATIGNFDGLHLGHQQLVTQVVKQAKVQGLLPTVITFEPLPQTVLQPHQPFFRLMDLRQKLTLLKSWGIKQVIGLRFNESLARLTPETFIEKYLIENFKIRHLIVGENFRFGHQQRGEIATLLAATQSFDFQVEPLKLHEDQEIKISSSLIRQALLQSQIQKANSWLGRNFSLTGKVIKGAMLGRQLGFPTANLAIRNPNEQLRGVFLTQVTWEDQSAMGVANLGVRPTVDGKKYAVEVHLLNFSGDLYGKRLTLAFLHKIRDEMRFAHIEELKQRISQDVQEALTIYDRD